ncbi:nuclear receptor coactivator 6 isoform X2 [Drosophila eugracilis]|uniref:nuclear receptor coactivator 6 isoform X2 n=1 Tax=Drosophila eugracilis TaxID=29029 RepID=UPI001BD9BDFD|nr:nuclear receptor coactivator 6 isoform X2 [Drosophila eugracilis]
MAAASAGQQQQQHQHQHKLNIAGSAETVASEMHHHHQQQHHQFFQQEQTKFVSRVVTSATVQQQQHTQQILPAGLVNGNGSGNMMQVANLHLQHQQQQQQQQQTKQRQAQIKLPIKSTATHMPTTIASRQMSQNNQLYAKNVAKANNASSNSNSNSNNNTNRKATTITGYNGNLAPGWRRLTNNNEVAYISPSGKTLRTQFQIKDYLLTQGTCKCGLPCPLRPEYLFDFNAQVPNMPLKLPMEASTTMPTPCLHQRRILESQQLQLPQQPQQQQQQQQQSQLQQQHIHLQQQQQPQQAVKDVSVAVSVSGPAAVSDVFSTLMTSTSRTATTATPTAATSTPAAATSPAQTATTTTHELANKDADCHKFGNNKLPASVRTTTTPTSMPMPASTPTFPLPNAMPTSQTLALGGVQVSGGHPKRSTGGHVIKQPANAFAPPPTPPIVPGGATTVIQQQQQQQPHQHPNFKDDPAGYLQQQTAMLHSSLGVGLDGTKTAAGTATARALPQEPIVHSSQQLQHQQQLQQQQHLQQLQRQKIRRLSLFGKWETDPAPATSTQPSTGPRTLQVDTAAFARPQKPQITSVTLVPAPQESPVSSSASETLEKRPEQVGAISTSHESPRQSLSSPTDSIDSAKSTPSASPKPQMHVQMQPQLLQMRTQTQVNLPAPAPVTVPAHVRLMRQQQTQIIPGQRLAVPSSSAALATMTRSIVTSSAGASTITGRPVTTTLANSNPTVAQLQSMANAMGGAGGGGQLIMTSSGQLLVIPTPSKQTTQHHRPGQPGQGVIIQQQQPAELHPQPGGGYIVSQPSPVATASSSSSSSTVILNSGGAKLLHHQIITSQAGQINQATAGGTGNQPQAVLLNTLANGGYIVQQQQQSQAPHQAEQILAMPQPPPAQTLIISSPDTKRRARKRKNSICHTPPPNGSPAKTISPQISPSIPSQAPAMLHQQAAAAAPQFQQQFQLSPGIQGIVVNKPNPPQAQQTQQLLLQNGQILQQVNLIGQQLLMPAGLVMGPDATLLQIQNMPTTSLMTPQGPVMLRTPSPQSKPSFISPSAGGQQYLVGANGQLSPIGQIYSTPMGLVMPTGQQGGASFVQASPTTTTIQIQQQPAPQPTQISLQPAQATYVTETVMSRQGTAASPPDTTTCSPRSPERPPSHRSSGSDMVQCVSSSEPDAAVSPQSVESRQSPSSTDCERSICNNNLFTQPTGIYKHSDPKIRRIHITSQSAGENGISLMQGQESPTTTQLQSSVPTPPILEAPSTVEKATNKTPTKRSRRPQRGAVRATATPMGRSFLLPPRSFAIGELIWGPARGHPAWPGKIVKMPDGVCTPSQQFDHVWVQWFGGGGRSTSELIPVNSLQSLSEGLEAHHKAQKDTRKSRKLNSQLERAIQEAMTELDNISASTIPAATSSSSSASIAVVPASAGPAVIAGGQQQQQQQYQQQQQQSPSSTNNKINGLARSKRQANTSGASMMLTTSTAATLSGLFNQQRAKPIRIAPAPPAGATGTGTLQGAGATAVATTGTGTTLARSEILKLTK